MTADVGAHAGRKMIAALADAHVRVRAALAPMESAVKSAQVTAHMETWERELAAINRDLIGSLFEGGEVPEALRKHVDSLAGTEHQVQFFVNLGAAVLSVFAIAGAINAGGIAEITQKSMHHTPVTPLSPQAAAQAVVNNVLSENQGAEEAQLSGMNRERFFNLLEITGQPLAPQTLLEAYRRGIIDSDRLQRGLLQGDTRNEWFDVLRDLRYSPPGAATAIQGAVQGFLTESESKSKAQEAGLAPGEWQWMYDLAGNPPGPETILSLINRGDMTVVEGTAALRESNLKNRYIPTFLKSRRHLMQQEQIRMSVNHGTMTDDQAVRRFMALGYDHDDAAALLALAHGMKTEATKDLARTQVVSGYEDRMFTRAKAHSMLVGLGYDDVESDFLLDLADHDREQKFIGAAVSRVHTVFVRRRLSRLSASSALDRLGVPPDQRDDLLKLWDLEREADTPDLTAAQWQGLLRRGVVDEARFRAEMVAKGYTDEEAGFLVPLAFPPSAFTAP